jgi:predicted nucleic acid-binding protein
LTEAVLDASVVLRWFETRNEPGTAAAQVLRQSFESGALTAFAPTLLILEVVNVAGRSWRWQQPALLELASTLQALRFEIRDPELRDIARWTARGLTAYDATYVALAESEALKLVTDDRAILKIAPNVASPLVET